MFTIKCCRFPFGVSRVHMGQDQEGSPQRGGTFSRHPGSGGAQPSMEQDSLTGRRTCRGSTEEGRPGQEGSRPYGFNRSIEWSRFTEEMEAQECCTCNWLVGASGEVVHLPRWAEPPWLAVPGLTWVER